ncbi:MAG: hypothetical protein KAG84_04870 [Bacteroidales bacterium]|nr:hypothetical protein [Bacteroidales bacterium]
MNRLLNMKKGTITVIISMTVISLIGLSIAWIYYANINNAEDPRVIDAKLKYNSYNSIVQTGAYDQGLLILDSIADIYQKYDDYKNSYEMGVVLNNKAAIYLTLALAMNDGIEKNALLESADINVKQSITIYENWLSDFGDLSDTEIRNKIEFIYNNSKYAFDKEQINNYIDKRISDIELAQRETVRRLSVSYTNLGIVLRNRNEIEQALNNYKKAIELWSKNLTAENNINLILGRPLKEQSTLERLFPDQK